jgi:hypothetical protein
MEARQSPPILLVEVQLRSDSTDLPERQSDTEAMHMDNFADCILEFYCVSFISMLSSRYQTCPEADANFSQIDVESVVKNFAKVSIDKDENAGVGL